MKIHNLLLLRAAKTAVTVLLLTATTPAFAFASLQCNDGALEQDLKAMYERQHSADGLQIIDFEDERETSELPGNAMGTTILSCKANVLVSNSLYYHMLYNIEQHDNGKTFTGFQIGLGKYAVAPPPGNYPPSTSYGRGGADTLLPAPSSRPHYQVTPAPATVIPDTPTLSAMFQKGFADRAAWENWVSSLTSDYRTGAEYWAGQRSLPHPGTCYGQPDFTAGCNEARRRLAPADALRKSEPDYRTGWNSYGH